MNNAEQQMPPIVDSHEATAVHLSYIRRDIVEIKTSLSELQHGYVTRLDFDEHLKVDADHEARLRAQENITQDFPTVKKIVYGCVAAILFAFISALIYLTIPHA